MPEKSESRSDKRDAIIVTFQEKKPEWSFPRTRLN